MNVRSMETSARDGVLIILLVKKAVAVRSGVPKKQTNLSSNMCRESQTMSALQSKHIFYTQFLSSVFLKTAKKKTNKLTPPPSHYPKMDLNF